MMKQQHLKFKWQQIIPKPDPIYGIPLPRSSHGVSILRDETDDSKTTKLLVYGGEHIARTPIDNEASSLWICDLTNVKSMLSSSSKSSSIAAKLTATKSSETVDTSTIEEDQTTIWKRIQCTRYCEDNVSSTGSRLTPTTSAFPPSRIAHAQAVYQNRYVYIFGGRSGVTMQEQPMNDLWVLDTMTNPSKSRDHNDNDDYKYSWSPVEVDMERSDPIPEPRSYHRMICIGDMLYMFGGCGTAGRLNDLYKFDIVNRTWHNLGCSTKLRGRGGTNMIPLLNQTQIAIVCGFTGQEMSDGHIYDISKQKWDRVSLTPKLDGVRPRSVCVNASFTQNGIAILFGGEVNPSDRGHAGAGSFGNDIVVLDEQLGFHVATIPSPEEKRLEKQMTSQQLSHPKHKWHDRDFVEDINVDKYQQPWPVERGWADAAYFEEDGVGYMYMFGGLSGTDNEPIRLNDLWKLEVCHT